MSGESFGDATIDQGQGQGDTVVAAETPPVAVDAGDGDVTDAPEGLRYVWGSVLGRGGMGEVRSVRDERLGREVAVKHIGPEQGGSSLEGRRRFLREARIQGQLEHPTIVPVYDLEVLPHGEARLYMKRVRGTTLEHILTALAAGDPATTRRFPLRRLLTAFVNVCRGIDYAHARAVVHRDIKPGNIMLGEFGEVHLLDWGIARVARADDGATAARQAAVASQSVLPVPASATQPDPDVPTVRLAPRLAVDDGATAAGTLLGTPGYMAPEQARGELQQVSARSDVFSLGAVLFEILTRRPLLPGSDTLARLHATLAMSAPPVPSATVPGTDIAPELDAICVQACAPRPEERFATAGGLAEAVDRYLDGDRDLALRQALAQGHIESAEAALREGTGTGHAHAVSSLARALALDPGHPIASRRLVELLVEAPRELPPQAASEVEATRQQVSSTTTRFSLGRGMGGVMLTILGVVMGLRRPGIASLVPLGLLASSGFNVWWLHARSERARQSLFVLAVTAVTVALTAMSYVAGPAMIVPALALVNGLILMTQSDFRRPALVIAGSLVPLLWLFVLAALGLEPWPYAIARDGIVIPANVVYFPPLLTMSLLVVTNALQVLVPMLVVSKLRARLRSVEERLLLHSWHLRQLAVAPTKER